MKQIKKQITGHRESQITGNREKQSTGDKENQTQETENHLPGTILKKCPLYHLWP